MIYGKKRKLKEITRGKFKGTIRVTSARYYHLIGILDIYSLALMSETGNIYSMNYKLRDIVLSLSVVIDHFSNEIFRKNYIKEIKNFDCLIKKLDELNLITTTQRKFLNDFRELRNFLAHQKIYSKIYFKGKPLLTRVRVRNLIKEICDIIVHIEEKSKIKAKFNYQHIYKLISEDLKLEADSKLK